ncbi:MAG: biliverdin-producing heme oxygenase [Gammaproteobacteria bacterium]|nr:iron-containing redox enzyme family protein [Gammaproteobacteria bacterium]PCH62168.1 MAG: biliverdin-producing heme oxygenase [Gammaproteobacteria bacterium]
MSFFDQLKNETEQEKRALLSSPIIVQAMNGTLILDEYVAFLSQAYHHVKHTVPLLMAVGSRLPENYEWLREAIAEYIEEELGHQEWVLNDIAACGFNKEAVRTSDPIASTELMVSYAYDMAQRINPIGFFGMVHVLEGTSIAVADKAADGILSALSLPKNAFSYLYSHGSLDQDHVKFFAGLMNKIEDPTEQTLIIHTAKMFYRLYGDIFRSLSAHHGIPLTA